MFPDRFRLRYARRRDSQDRRRSAEALPIASCSRRRAGDFWSIPFP
jgi:hypothetical protein